MRQRRSSGAPSCSCSSFSAGWGTWVVFRAVPTAFVPEEDEGYFLTIVQAPAGASLEYTTNIAKQIEAILAKEADICGELLGRWVSASAVRRRTTA